MTSDAYRIEFYKKQVIVNIPSIIYFINLQTFYSLVMSRKEVDSIEWEH